MGLTRARKISPLLTIPIKCFLSSTTGSLLTSFNFIIDSAFKIGWERWGNFPRERERLVRLVGSTGAQGVVFLSGDRHIGALYRETAGTPYPLYELTSSGITHPWRNASEAGPNRLGDLFTDLHYGSVDIDWDAAALSLSVRDIDGKAQRTALIPLNQLKERS